MPAHILSIGEAMVELAPAGAGLLRAGYAGDTFNTAWYAKRLLGAGAHVAYGSVIGTDRISQDFTDFVSAQGIDTSTLCNHPERTMGLYMIALHNGERSFSYWRGQSAARTLADDVDWLTQICTGRDYIHLSGITLAILAPDARTRLFTALAHARAAGSVIVFDTNQRPRLWESHHIMCDTLHRAALVADIILPSFDEESQSFGDTSPMDTIDRYRAFGPKAVIVKNGADPVQAWTTTTGSITHAPQHTPPVDSTAAGDSFGAAIIAGLVRGQPWDRILMDACTLAAQVISHSGALVPQIFTEDTI